LRAARADAKAKGVKFGRKPILTAHQQREARERIAAGETQRSIARTYNVSQATLYPSLRAWSRRAASGAMGITRLRHADSRMFLNSRVSQKKTGVP